MGNSVKVKLGRRRIDVSRLRDIDLTGIVTDFERNYINTVKLREGRLKCQIKISTYSSNCKDGQYRETMRTIVDRVVTADDEIFGPDGLAKGPRMPEFLVKVITTLLTRWDSSMKDRLVVKIRPPRELEGKLMGHLDIKINLTDLEVLDEKIR